jgi:hypothetical protein
MFRSRRSKRAGASSELDVEIEKINTTYARPKDDGRKEQGRGTSIAGGDCSSATSCRSARSSRRPLPPNPEFNLPSPSLPQDMDAIVVDTQTDWFLSVSSICVEASRDSTFLSRSTIFRSLYPESTERLRAMVENVVSCPAVDVISSEAAHEKTHKDTNFSLSR